MPEETEVSTVIGHIYEASYRPSFWPKALESIAKFTHSSSAALMYQDNELESVGDAYTYNISAEVSAKHQAYGQDPNFRIMSESVPLDKAAAISTTSFKIESNSTIYTVKNSISCSRMRVCTTWEVLCFTWMMFVLPL